MILSASGGTKSGEKSLDRVIENISRYLLVTSKTIPEALLHNAKEIAEALFILTPRASGAVIREKVKSLQGRFIRAPKGFAERFKGLRGLAKDGYSKKIQAARIKLFNDLGVKRKPREKTSAAFRRAAEKNPMAAEAYRKLRRLTLEEERIAAITYRTNHIGSMASSWRPALRKLKSKMTAADKEKRVKMRPQSFVEISEDGLTITITNEMPGLVKLANKTGFTSAALDARSYDIEQHIEEVMGRALQSLVKPV